MSESPLHLKMKKIVSEKLRSLGFQTEEEYTIRINEHNYRVDVVGFKGDKKVAVECGKTDPSKLEALSKVFDEVYTFDEHDLIRVYEEIIEKQEREIEKLREELSKIRTKHFILPDKTIKIPILRFMDEEKIKRDLRKWGFIPIEKQS